MVWQAALIQSHLEEMSVQAAMALVDLSDNGEFDPAKPSLGCVKGSPADKSKIFTRVAFTNPLLPWISQGAASTAKVKNWCEALKNKVEQMLPHIDCAILQAAAREVWDMCECVLTLLDIDTFS